MKTDDIDRIESFENIIKLARNAELWQCVVYLYDNGFEDASRALKQKAEDVDKDKK